MSTDKLPRSMWACLLVHPRTGRVELHIGNRATVMRCAVTHPRISHAIEISQDVVALPRAERMVAAEAAVRMVNPDFKR